MKPLPFDEYENAAEWCARRGYKGKEGDPLPTLLSKHTHDLIQADIDTFAQRVAQYAYALAMNKLNLPEE